jgi:hypothetical protein
MRITALLICGLVIGSAATGVGLWLGVRNGPEADVGMPQNTSTTTLAAAEEPTWYEAGETRIESTLIIPGELTVGEDSARLAYELRSLTQQYPITFGPYPAALPAAWLLTTTSGATVEGVTDPPNHPQNSFDGEVPPLRDSVAFELPDGTSPAHIATIEVVEWRLAAPIEMEVTLPATPGASFLMLDGSEVTLANILEQSNGTIFDFDIEREFDPWRMTEDSHQFLPMNGTFVPVGDGWSQSTFTLGTGFQLTWSGATAPAEVRLAVRTTEWVPVSGSRIVQPAVVDG